MNKYWIHEPTGKKAMVVKEESYFVWLLWKDEKFDWRLYKSILKEFYIPITKAEYDSSLTLEEIKRNRKLFFNLVENDEIICESDCKSNCDTDIETGDVLRVKAKGENIAILYGLTESIKNIKLAVEEDTINKHFRLYNQEDRTEEYIHNTGVELTANGEDITGKVVRCIADLSNLNYDDIHFNDYLLITRYNDGLVYIKAIGDSKDNEFVFSLDDFKKYFEIIDTHDVINTFKSHNIFESICQDMIATHKAKNHDYGSSFHNLFKELGINYAYGHLREKLERIKTLKDNEAKVKGESMIDSLKDLANYAIMTIIELQDGKKN